MKNLIIISLCLLFTGCATLPEPIKPPTAEELAKMDYGSPLTIDYEKFIKNYFNENLKDPESARYKFQQPRHFWYRDSPILGGKEYIGYAIFAEVNAKNSFGGYNGFEPYIFIFKNNILTKYIDPDGVSLIGSFKTF